MVEIDHQASAVRDKILLASPAGIKLNALTSRFFADTDLQLDSIAERIAGGREPPTVLWNVRPSSTFNVLHAIFCNKLKYLEEVGFNCVVVLYDKLVEKHKRVRQQEIVSLQETTRNCIRWFVRAGLRHDRTEFLTESDLWSFIEFEEFGEMVTSFAHICRFTGGGTAEEDLPSGIMDNLCEIYYESLINCDVLLTGFPDVQNIWGMLRQEILNRNLLPRYTPPLVLYYPRLNGIDGGQLSSSSDANSLSIRDTEGQIMDKIRGCRDDFLGTLFDLVIVPWKSPFSVDGQAVYSFEQLRTLKSPEEIRTLIATNTVRYFQTIRGTTL